MTYPCCDHCSMYPHAEGHPVPCSFTCGGSVEIPNKPPSSPMETTDAPEQRPDHTGVIHGADEARVTKWADAILDATGGWAIAEPNTRGLMAVADAELAALTDLWKARLATAQAKVAMREATIERLWAQLNEATNVPDDRCEGCSDPHCTATT